MKQVKRYVLGILVSIETRKINETDCFLEDILTSIEKYNDNKANPYYLGDIKIDHKKGIITFKKYKKLTDMRTLKDLDKLTLNYNNEAELLRNLNISIDSNNPVLIMYRGQKTIKYLHVLYNKDRKYLDQGFVSSHFIENGRSFDFLTFLFSKNHFFKTAKNYDELEGLYNLRRDIMNNIPALISLTPMINFYNAFIAKNDKYNYFNFRMLGTLLKEYDSNNCDSQDLEEDTKEDFFFIKQNSTEKMLQEVISLSTGRLEKFGNYDFFKNIQILTPTKKGPLGTRELNKKISAEQKLIFDALLKISKSFSDEKVSKKEEDIYIAQQEEIIVKVKDRIIMLWFIWLRKLTLL